MKLVYFDAAAIIVLLTILFSSAVRKTTRGSANRVFFLTILDIFLASICSIIYISIENSGGSDTLNYIFHWSYLLFHNLTALCYLTYLIMLTDTMHKVRKNVLLIILDCLPVIISVSLLVINNFYPILFTIQDGVYESTDSMYLMYAIGLFYLGFGMYYTIRYRKLFTLKVIVTLFIMYPIIITAMIIEYFYPNIIIELFADSIGVLFVYATIRRPEELLDDDAVNTYNVSSYTQTVKKAFSNDKPFKIIIINISNYETIRNVVNVEAEKEVTKFIGDRINQITKKYHLRSFNCYLKDGRFRVLVDDSGYNNILPAAQEIDEYLRQPFMFGRMEILLSVAVCIIDIPGDIQTYDQLVAFGNNFNEETSGVSSAQDILKEKNFRIMMKMDTIIENALLNNTFEIYYQPIYSVEKKRYVACEALLRLNTEEFGFINPQMIVEHAEQTGVIDKISAFVLKSVCKFVSSDIFADLGIDYVEVNLSAEQFVQENLAERVRNICSVYKVDPSRINIEVTETAIAQSRKMMAKNLQKFVNYGFEISLDDFGKGYSNMQRLAELPISIVKIDREFSSSVKNERNKTLLSNILKMIRALDLKVVIEGVETMTQLDIFEEMGADFIQGYYFSKPISEDEFVRFISKYKI